MPVPITDTRTRLSLLWVFVMLNMILADVLSFLSAEALQQILEGHAGQIAITPGFILLAAAMTEIPIAMVLLCLVLPRRALRWANVVAAAFTVVYVFGLGSTAPHYIFIAGMEALGCILIAWTAWRWREPVAAARGRDLATE
jgi:hypothetical protein